MKIIKIVSTAVLIIVIFGMVVSNVTSGGCSRTKQVESRIILQKLVQAIQVYELDTGQYPSFLSDLHHNAEVAHWMGPYVKEKDITDPWGRKYRYFSDSLNKTVILFTLGSDHTIGGKNHANDLLILAQNSNITLFTQAFKPFTK